MFFLVDSEDQWNVAFLFDFNFERLKLMVIRYN